MQIFLREAQGVKSLYSDTSRLRQAAWIFAGHRYLAIGEERGNNWTHSGIDIAAGAGTLIHASAGGVIAEVGIDGDSNNSRPWYGNYVMIDHGDGMETLYAHMVNPSELAVDARVAQGDVLGGVDTTGNSTGNHLHFEIRSNGVAVNSRRYLPEGVYPR